jgi:hypothetical protein
VDLLSEEDQRLPQVLTLLPALKRGIHFISDIFTPTHSTCCCRRSITQERR